MCTVKVKILNLEIKKPETFEDWLVARNIHEDSALVNFAKRFHLYRHFFSKGGGGGLLSI